MNYRFFFVLAIVFLFGCTKEDSKKKPKAVNVEGSSKVYILNEGNFNWNNASVSLIDLDKMEVHNQQFEAKNGFVIGDVLQSATQVGEFIYWSVNNSAKIVKTDTQLVFQENMASHSPRYLAPYHQQLFVSHIYQNSIDVIDLTSHTKTAELSTTGWTEFSTVADSILWVAQNEPNGIWKINLNHLTQEFFALNDSTSVTGIHPYQGAAVLIGTNRNIFELTPQFDTSHVVENVNTYRFSYNSTTSLMYWLENGLKSYHMGNKSISTLLKSTEWQNAYGLGVNPEGTVAIICDAKDYQRKGEAIVYDLINHRIDTRLEVGIIPQFVLFAP